MKNYKHTIFGYFLIALFVALSLSSVFKSNAIYSYVPEPEVSGLFYSMQMPFLPGSMFSDRVEQVLLDQSHHTSKSLDNLKYSAVQVHKAYNRHIQYVLKYDNKQIKSICDLNCVIQI